MGISLELGCDVIRNYKRLSYKVWYALAELIDNSTQSYFNNKAALDKKYAKGDKNDERLKIHITYDKKSGLLRISDNAMGMSYNELVDALKIGKPPANTRGRSQFGMGLKTAACWFGNEWTIVTKKLGETTEHRVTVDVEKVASGAMKNLPYKQRTDRPASSHYTVIEIQQLNMKLQGSTLTRTKDYLGSMYRVDLRAGILEIYWEDAKLPGPPELKYMQAHDGSSYWKDFKFTIDGHEVRGWMAILGQGSSGRPNAGFTIIRRGRVIVGWPVSWRPESIFGQPQGSNDLINQRIVGEIELDDFAVSHTKDDILWAGSQDDELQQALLNEAIDYIAKAKMPRGGDNTGPSPAVVQTATDHLEDEIKSKEFVDLIEVDTVPPPEVIEKSSRPMIDQAKKQQAKFVVTFDDMIVKLYLADASPMDLYYSSDVTGPSKGIKKTSISVIVNVHHPHWMQQLGNSESVLNYLRHCVYDAIAEWQCRRKTAGINSQTIKLLKDNLLRLPSRIEQADAEQGGQDSSESPPKKSPTKSSKRKGK